MYNWYQLSPPRPAKEMPGLDLALALGYLGRPDNREKLLRAEKEMAMKASIPLRRPLSNVNEITLNDPDWCVNSVWNAKICNVVSGSEFSFVPIVPPAIPDPLTTTETRPKLCYYSMQKYMNFPWIVEEGEERFERNRTDGYSCLYTVPGELEFGRGWIVSDWEERTSGLCEEVKIFRVDVGGIVTVPWKNLRRIDAEFCQAPPLAGRAKLVQSQQEFMDDWGLNVRVYDGKIKSIKIIEKEEFPYALPLYTIEIDQIAKIMGKLED